jgi:hypothetical protein
MMIGDPIFSQLVICPVALKFGILQQLIHTTFDKTILTNVALADRLAQL